MPAAAMELTLSEAGILSTFLEAILYGEHPSTLMLRFSDIVTGFSVLMFIFTMWIVLSNRRRRRLNYAMLSAAWAIFVLSTAVRLNRVRCTMRADRRITHAGDGCEHSACAPRLPHHRAGS